MADRELRIKVGAAIDSSFQSVMREVVDATKRARKQIVSEMRGSANESARAHKDGAKETEKVFLDTAKVAKSVAGQMKKDAAQAAKERVKEEKSAFKEVERDLKAHNRNMNAEIKRGIAEERSAQRAANRERIAAAKDWARQEKDLNREMNAHVSQARRLNRQGGGGRGQDDFWHLSRGGALALRTTGAVVGGAARLAGSALRGMGVDTSLQSQLAGSVDREDLAMKLANTAWISSGKGPAGSQERTDPKSILGGATSAGIATGTDTEDVLKGLDKFVAMTGDLQTAQSVMEEIGKTAKANGAEFHDMMEASAAVSNAMGDMTNKGPAITAVMRAMAGQGQLSAIEIKDLAKNMGYLTAQANNFKIDPMTAKVLTDVGITNDTTQRVAVAGALAQYARQKGGRISAKQATRSAMTFLGDLANPHEVKRMLGAGINPYADAGHTQVRDPLQMILEIFRHGRTKGGVSLDAINNLIPNQQSRAVVNSIGQDYNAAYKKAAAGGIMNEDARHHAATKAVIESFEGILKTTQSLNEVDMKFTETMKDAKSQSIVLNNEFGKLTDQLRDSLTPALGSLVTVVREMNPYMQAALNFYKKMAGISDSDSDAQTGDVEAKGLLARRALNKGIAAGHVPGEAYDQANVAEDALKAEIKRTKTRLDSKVDVDKKMSLATIGLHDTTKGVRSLEIEKLNGNLKELTEQLGKLQVAQEQAGTTNRNAVNDEIQKVELVNLPHPGAKPATRGLSSADAGFGVSYPAIAP